jgi:hypothetical protein
MTSDPKCGWMRVMSISVIRSNTLLKPDGISLNSSTNRAKLTQRTIEISSCISREWHSITAINTIGWSSKRKKESKKRERIRKICLKLKLTK